MTPLRVLLLHDYGVAVGGAENLSFALRRELRDRGHDVRLLTSDALPLALPIEADATFRGSMGASRRVLQAFNPFARAALVRELRTFRPDVVHVRMFMSQSSPSILPLLAGVPSVLHVVNYDLVCPLNTRVLPDGRTCHRRQGIACRKEGCLPRVGHWRAEAQRWQWRRHGAAFDRIVCNSHAVAALLRKDGVPVDGVIWNGVPERPARPEPPPGAPVQLGCASRLVPKKGVDWLLRAFARIAPARPAVRLLIAGDGPERDALQRLAAELGIADRVRWIGHVTRDGLETAFADLRAQVVPSRWAEPFGLVAAEAMMRGTAAIVSDGGGLAEQVLDGVTGYTVPSDDVDALADRMARLADDRELALRFGRAGRVRALAEFTEGRVVEDVLALYAELLGRAAVPADAPIGGAVGTAT